jgi:LMBR1 domain-containing protein 1
MHFGKLLMGLVGSVLSLAWFIHILVYLLPKTLEVQYGSNNIIIPTAFLNDFFGKVFQAPVFGIVFYGLFSFWLLLCVIKGAIKMGVRFLFITIHPMK